MEKIIPVVKFIFFNFDYFLIFILLLTWFLVKKKPNSSLAQKITKFGQNIYNGFIKLCETKTLKLLVIFFIINFIIRFLMALVVPEISLTIGDIIGPHYFNLAQSMYEGQGFTTHVIWNNFLQPSQVVRPDFFRVPFYPLLITLSYYVFGNTHLAAQLVNVIGGSLLPILAYLLAWVLTKSKRISILLLILMSVNMLILTWVVMPGPEIIYGCCVLILLACLYKTRDKISWCALAVGAAWALAYLTRTEGLYIFLPVIIFYYFYHFYKQDKKKLITHLLLTFLGVLIIASPYFARNYILTGNPIYSDFDRVVMVAYVDYDYLIESPEVEYKNIYDLASHHPGRVIKRTIEEIVMGIEKIPHLLLNSYAISLLALIGIYYTWRENHQKYYFIFLSIITGFLIPIIAIGFTDRYFIFLLVLFYFFAGVGVFKLSDIHFKNKPLPKSLLIIYFFLFVCLSGFVGVVKGTVPYIPHSFYQRFDAKTFYPALKEFYDYVKENTPSNEVVMASRHVYEVRHFTKHPVAIFPFTNAEGIQKFMKKYQVKWVIWAGQPSKIGDKYYRFWLPDEIPENVKLEFHNPGGSLYKVEYYMD